MARHLAEQARTEEQKVALGVGRISFEEYEEGMLAAIACIRELGMTPTTPELVLRGTKYRFSFSSPDEELFDKGLDCIEEHWRAVSSAWRFVHMPTEAERQEVRQPFIDCLRDEGVEVPEAPTPRDWLNMAMTDRTGAWNRCQAFIEETYAIEAYSGG